MPGKYSKEQVLDILERAHAKEAELIVKFQTLQKETGQLETLQMFPTKRICKSLLTQSCLLRSVGSQIGCIKANMERIQYSVELLEKNESELERKFRERVEEMEL